MRTRALVFFLLAASGGRSRAQVTGLEFHASSSVEGVAPASLVTGVTITNRNAAPVDLQFGACALKLRAYRSPDKSRKPVWYSELAGLPFIKHAQQMCILVLYQRTLAPGQSIGAPTFGSKIPTYEILADSLPEGRYYFTAQLELNNQLFTFDAGSAVISSKQQPLPRSRTIDSVQFSASVTRVWFGNGIPDSLDVTFKAHNTTNATRWLSAEGNPGCLGIMGYKTRERRDSYYLRPAYDNDWIIRPCPLPVSEFGLAAGELRVTTKRIPAPPSALHYTMYFEFRDKAAHSPEPTLSGDLAVDEGTNR